MAYSGHYLARPSATSRVFTLEYPILEDPTLIKDSALVFFFFFEIICRRPFKGGRALTDCSCVKSGGCGLFRNMADEIT